MDCNETRRLIDADTDGELDLVRHLELEAQPVTTEEVLEVASDADLTAAEGLAAEAERSRSVFVGRLDTAFAVQPGHSVTIPVETSKSHFFDLETGLAIR